MKKLFKGSRELDFYELLEINGGYGGSSGGSDSSNGSKAGYSYNYSNSNTNSGSSGYSGASFGSSGRSGEKSSKKNRSKKAKPSEAYSCLSGIYDANREKISIINGVAYSTSSGFIPCLDDNKKDSVEDGVQKEKYPGDGIVYPEKPNSPEDIFSIGEKINSLDTFKAYWNKLGIETKLQTKLLTQIQEDIDSGKFIYGKDGIRCDNYVQQLLTKCGIDYNQYFAGDADKYTVTDHIKNLAANDKYDSSTLEKGCSYVVFMCGDKVLKNGTLAEWAPHCGILTIAMDGTCIYADDSSGNKLNANDKTDPGRLAITTAKNINSLESGFGYSTFYYQKIK